MNEVSIAPRPAQFSVYPLRNDDHAFHGGALIAYGRQGAKWIRPILSPMRLILMLGLISLEIRGAESENDAWSRHVIDASSQGADGVRLADVDDDDQLDIVTGWEQGGLTRIYRNPGHPRVREPWPFVTVGRTPNVEDAVLVDLDSDGFLDVVSASEGNTRAISVHWAPDLLGRYFESDHWQQDRLPPANDAMQWMFVLPAQIDGDGGIDLVAGGKEEDAAIGWFSSPSNPRKLADWQWNALRPMGWLMSMESHDMNNDGRMDILFTDRRGSRSGAFWLEKPISQADLSRPWTEHPVGGLGQEVMFLTVGDLDQDGLEDVLVSAKPRQIYYFRRLDDSGLSWETYSISVPQQVGTLKDVSVGDLDLDGRSDIIATCEHADGAKSGVFWMSSSDPHDESAWRFHSISGPEGTKFDLLELLDLDGDGDLDIITCEERENLGVFWYENPTRSSREQAKMQ